MADPQAAKQNHAAARLTHELLHSGKISRSTARQLLTALGQAETEDSNRTPASSAQDILTWFAGILRGGFTALGALLAGIVVARQDSRAPKGEAPTGHDSAATSAGIGGIDSLLSFEAVSASLKPLFNEYIWWFVAMLLVISGSVMGIREAWLRFEGILRPLTILFAFFAYHALFLGLGIFLYRRSAATGRMLIVLSALLVPVMFSIADSVTRQSAEAGAAATLVALLLALVTLLPISNRLAVPYASAVLYLPVPFALAALFPLSMHLPQLAWVVIPAIGAAALSGTGLATGRDSIARFILASVGVLILLFILLSLNIAATDDLSRALRLMTVLAVLAQYAALMRTLDLTRLRFFAALEIVLYAVIALVAVAGSGAFGNGNAAAGVFTLRILALPLAMAIFTLASRYHNAAVHPLLFITMVFSFALSRLFVADPAWRLFAFFLPPLLVPWFSGGFHAKKQRLFGYWATAAGLAGSLLAISITHSHWAVTLLGALTALTIHRSAGFSRRGLHYLAVGGLVVAVAGLPLAEGVALNPAEIAAALAVLYAGAAWYFERRAQPAGDDEGYPLDDLSLLCGIAAAVMLASSPVVSPLAGTITAFGRNLSPVPVALVFATGVFLNLRALRDQSLVVSLVANLLGVAGIFNLVQPRGYAEGALVFAVGASVFYLVAAWFVKSTPLNAAAYGRVFLMRLRLPLNAGGSANIFYGAALAALCLLALVPGAGLNWIAMPDFDQRLLMLTAMAVFHLLLGLVFHLRTFAGLYLRGNVVLLFVLLAGIGLAAAINRLGRPLPVDQVGLRLLLLFPLVALLTALARVYGARYGEYLGAPRHGAWYYLAPVTAVIGLVVLEAYEAMSVSRLDFDRAFYLVPPTVYLGLALYPLVLAHTLDTRLRHVFFAVIPLFAAALFASQSFTGVPLAQNFGYWYPARLGIVTPELPQDFSYMLPGEYAYVTFRQNIVLGLAAGTLLLATLAVLSRRGGPAQVFSRSVFGNSTAGVTGESGYWSLGYTALIALLAFQVAAIQPGLLLLAVAGLYLLAANVRASAFVLFVAGLLVVHGGAHLPPVYPVWPGPVLVLLALLLLAPAKQIAARLDVSERFVSETAFSAGALYAIAALFYAAAEGQAANALGAAGSILNANAGYFLAGKYKQSAALVLTLLFAALWLRIALGRFDGHARSALSMLSHVTLAMAAVTATWFALSHTLPPYALLHSAPFVLPVVLVLQIVQSLRLKVLSETDDARFAGYTSARDLIIIAAGLVFVALARELQNPLPGAGYLTLVSLLLYLALNMVAAFGSGHTRYIYIAQAAIAGIYYSLRPILQIDSAQVDAFILFGYAFALTGVSVLAGRYGVTLVSEPTRRFAALVPLLVALFIDNFRSLGAAFYSLVASSLYLWLSRLGERNLFAMLAAVALNTALFLAALASGFDSSEFYAFPAGLTIIFFATIFKGSLTPENQARVRTIGGLVAYVPAAVHVTLRSGLAQDPVYSVVFGAVCLAGILAGSLLHIRSYLFLGMLFLTLDVIANLVQEGLQNQFVGFLLLTVTGLLLIAILIYYNLHKEAILGRVRAWRARLAAWN